MLYQAIDLNSGNQVAVGGLIGFEFAESLADSSYNGAAGVWQDKVTLTTNVLLAGAVYRIGLSYDWQYSSRSRNFRARLTIDGTQEFLHTQEPEEKDPSQRARVCSFLFYTGTGATVDLALQWTNENNSDTARIGDARLELWRVG